MAGGGLAAPACCSCSNPPGQLAEASANWPQIALCRQNWRIPPVQETLPAGTATLAAGFPNQQLGVSSWLYGKCPTVGFDANGTTRLSFAFSQGSRVSVNLEYVDHKRGAAVRHTFQHALLLSRGRVCIGLATYVRTAAADAGMAAEITNATYSQRKILLRLRGERLLTLCPERPVFMGSRVAVLDRSGTTVANPLNSTAVWCNQENTLFLPIDVERKQLLLAATQSGLAGGALAIWKILYWTPVSFKTAPHCPSIVFFPSSFVPLRFYLFLFSLYLHLNEPPPSLHKANPAPTAPLHLNTR